MIVVESYLDLSPRRTWVWYERYMILVDGSGIRKVCRWSTSLIVCSAKLSLSTFLSLLVVFSRHNALAAPCLISPRCTTSKRNLYC